MVIGWIVWSHSNCYINPNQTLAEIPVTKYDCFTCDYKVQQHHMKYGHCTQTRWSRRHHCVDHGMLRSASVHQAIDPVIFLQNNK